jgi:hypothetical protein
VGTKLWQPQQDWNKLSMETWDAMFLPGIAQDTESRELRSTGAGDRDAGQDGGPGSAPASYVLKPVDGRLLYLRRGRDVRKSEDEAVQEADVRLESLSLHLSSEPILFLNTCPRVVVINAYKLLGDMILLSCHTPAKWAGKVSSYILNFSVLNG